MLKSISLENYKCFKEKTDIEIAPLTVLCGVNSSGKSSILKSLLMLKQTAESNSSDGSIIFSGNLADCGTFQDVVCDNKYTYNNEFTITNRFEVNNHKLLNIGTFIKRQDAKDFNELRRMYFNVKGLITKFVFDIEIVVKSNKDSINEFSKYISNNIIKSYKIDISVYDDNGKIEGCNGYIKFEDRELRKITNTPHYLTWDNIPGFAQATKKFKKYKCLCTFNGLFISNIFDYRMSNNIKSIIPNILSIFRIISNQYKGIYHIAPLRNVPERTYVIRGNVDSVGLNGENTSILLAKLKNVPVTTDMYCPYTNTLEINEYGYVVSDYHTIIQQWLDYFEMEKLDVSGGDNGTVSLKVGSHNIADIGFGMSQMLPIITQGIFLDKEQTLLIEQPEIHLHPKMELQIADFLIRLAETGRNVIIETHSDYIKDRIIRRILEDDTRTLHEIISINFVENKQEDESNDMYSIVTPIIIKDDEGIKVHPNEFFDQGASEQLKIMRAGVLKRKKIRDNII